MDSRQGKERGILKLEPRQRTTETRSVLTPSGSWDRPPASPQPSVDRLSVTWAEPEGSMTSTVNLFHLTSETPISNEVRFPQSPGDGSDDEDYSVSLQCVLRQRRASVRRSRKGRGRRPSSPFLQDEPRRRRSSVYTSSSGDTAISIDEGQTAVTQEQIFENIHLHKEVLGSVKQQPLGMRRKLKIVHQAKAYIKKHEGQLQERLAQSKRTKDIYARITIFIAAKWQLLKREAANMSNLMIPWELRIKEIESHFGSVVASYFTFLRWLFWVNLVIGFILMVFVIVPEYLTANVELDGERKKILPEEQRNSTNLLILWEFEGILKCSPIFYGYYTNIERPEYRMPLAYFLTGLVVYIYSFVATLRKMAENSRMSKLSEKEDECIFSWKLFTGWDFMIGNTETAHNRIASVILGFKEALLEEAEKKKDLRNWRIISLRALVNVCVVLLLVISAYAVVAVVSRSDDIPRDKGWWRNNETTIVVTVISITFPVFFELLGFLEHYHPRKQLRLQLARIMLLNLLNLYSLIFALFSKIDGMSGELDSLKPPLRLNSNMIPELPMDFNETDNENITDLCIEVKIDCSPCQIIIEKEYNEIETTTSWQKQEKDTVLLLTVPNKMLDQNNLNGSINIPVENLVEDNLLTDSDNISEYLSEDISLESASSSESSSSSETTSLDNILSEYSTSSIPTLRSVQDELNKLRNIVKITANVTNETSVDTDDSIFYSFGESSESSDEVSDFPDATMNDWNVTATQQEENTEITDVPTNTISTEENYIYNLTFYDANDTESDNMTHTSLIDINEATAIYDWTTDTNIVTQETLSTENTEHLEINSTMLPQDYYTNVEYGLSTYCPDIQFNCSLLCGKENITQVFTIKKCSVIEKTCYVKKCQQIHKINLDDNVAYYDDKNRKMYRLRNETKMKLRKLCWETMFGQELVKLTMMDLVFVLLGSLVMDFFRSLFVRYMNKCWCWNLEKKFPEYGDFKIAENILHLINNQGMVWMGMFFSPGLVVLNIVKLVIMMYLRSWAVMTCNVPHEVVFRVSKSNNFYLALLLTMLFLCVLPVGFSIVWVKPSWHCGPFSEYDKIYHILTKNIYKILPSTLHFTLECMTSPAIVIPLLVLLILIIYYLTSLTNSLREANNDLKIQLRRERTEERRKMFQLADTRRKGFSALDNTPFARWKRVLPHLGKSIESDDRKSVTGEQTPEPKANKKKGGIFAKIVSLALDRKSDVKNEDRGSNMSPSLNIDDETDTEFHETLPKEVLQLKDITVSTKKTQDTDKNNQKDGKIKKVQEDSKILKEDEDKTQSMKHKNTINSVFSEAIESPRSTVNEVLHTIDETQSPENLNTTIPVITISATESDDEVLQPKSDRNDVSDLEDNDKVRPAEKKLTKTNTKSLHRQSSVDSVEKNDY